MTTPQEDSTPIAPSDDVKGLALHEAMLLAEPLVTWCVRHGINYGQLGKTLKLLFFEQAQQHLARQQRKLTDSALSIVSGLHRGDVVAFRRAKRANADPADPSLPSASALAQHSLSIYKQRISPSQQVLARWLALGLPTELNLRTPAGKLEKGTNVPTFSALVRSAIRTTSQGFSVSLVLEEMQHQGMVERHDNKIRLIQSPLQVQIVDKKDQRFTSVSRDFLRAGLSNLLADLAPPFLEQSLDVDGIQPTSVAHLHEAFRQGWLQLMQSLTPLAIALHEQDVLAATPTQPAQRMRLGVYVYAEDMPEHEQGARKNAAFTEPELPDPSALPRRPNSQ